MVSHFFKTHYGCNGVIIHSKTASHREFEPYATPSGKKEALAKNKTGLCIDTSSTQNGSKIDHHPEGEQTQTRTSIYEVWLKTYYMISDPWHLVWRENHFTKNRQRSWHRCAIALTFIALMTACGRLSGRGHLFGQVVSTSQVLTNTKAVWSYRIWSCTITTC